MAWLYKRKNSKFWWIGWRIGKQIHFRSTKTADRKLADQELAKVDTLFKAHKAGLLDQVYQSISGRSIESISLAGALSEWLEEVKHERGDDSTHARYEDVANQFSKFMGVTPTKPLLSEVTSEKVRQYLIHRWTKCSASTTNLERKILSVFFRRAMKNEQLKFNPVAAVKPFKDRQGEEMKRRAFTVKELQLLYQKAPPGFWRYMIVGGFYSGLRMGDLITLAWPSVDFVEKMLRVKTGKTSKTVHIPIASPLQVELVEIYARAGKPRSGYVWPDRATAYNQKGSGQFSNEFYELVLQPCGLVPERDNKKGKGKGRGSQREINPISFHSLRHSFVSLLKATGGSQIVAKELAGHSSDLVSDNYTKLPPEVLTKAIDALPMIGEGK